MTSLDIIMTFISFVSSGWADLLWAGLASVLLVYRRRFYEAAVVFSGYSVGGSLVLFLQPFFARPRPPRIDQVESYGFPSGHTLSTTVLVTLLVWAGFRVHPDGRVRYTLLAITILAAVGTSRIYLRAHWPVDVWAAYAFGLAFTALWVRATRRLKSD